MAIGKYQQWLTPEGLLQLESWARNGLTDEQIALNIGINRRTLTDWKSKYTPISLTLKKGKEVIDIQVENALLKRALGYNFTEVTRERIVDYDEKTGEKTGSHIEVTKEVTKEVQPDVTAQIFWLKNRKPQDWRDRKDINANVNNTDNPFAGLTTEELKKMVFDG